MICKLRSLTAQFAKVFRGSNIKFNIVQSSKQPFFKPDSTSDLINSAQRIYYTRFRRNHQHQCVAKLSQPIQGVFYTRVGLGDAICLPLLVKRRRRRRPVPPWSWLRDWNETALCACNRHDAPTRCRSAFSNRFPQFCCGENKPLLT